MAIDKLSVYNDALLLIGERQLASLTENRETRYRLDAIYDYDAVNYCLETVKPRFACRTQLPAQDVGFTNNTGFSYVHSLPSDYVALAGIFSDSSLTAPIGRYIFESNKIFSDHATIYLRYVSSDVAYGLDLGLWTPSFAKVVSAYLAKELAPRTRPDLGEIALQALIEATKLAVDLNKIEEPQPRAKKPTATLNADLLNIYNEALMLCGQSHLETTDEDTENRAILDRAMDTGLVNAALEDTPWYFAKASQKIDYNPSLEPEWGYKYVFDYPPDLYRLVGVFSDEYMNQPLKQYQDEAGRIYADVQTIYVEFIPDDLLNSPSAWPGYFRRLISAELAMRVSPLIQGADPAYVGEQHKRIRDQALSNDAVQSPPRRIALGSWVSARMRYESNRRRP